MDQHDVEKACVLPLISPESAPITQPVTTAIAAYRLFPERLIPFASLDPRAVTEPGKRTGHVGGVKGMIEILKRYQDAGLPRLENETKSVASLPETDRVTLVRRVTLDLIGLPTRRRSLSDVLERQRSSEVTDRTWASGFLVQPTSGRIGSPK